MYEALELEVDQAVLSVAEGGGEGSADATLLDEVTAAAPIRSARRIKHSVQLASKLLATSRQLEHSQRQCKQLEHELELLKNENSALKQDVQRSRAPQGHLVSVMAICAV